MTSTAKLNEFNHAEEPARELLQQLGWNYVPRRTWRSLVALTRADAVERRGAM